MGFIVWEDLLGKGGTTEVRKAGNRERKVKGIAWSLCLINVGDVREGKGWDMDWEVYSWWDGYMSGRISGSGIGRW